MSKITKTTRLLSGAARKCVTRPDEAWLLMQMAWWVAVLSVTARCYSLPRALEIVAGNQQNRRRSSKSREELARAIDLLLSADVFVFKPICWKRAAVLHRYLSQTRIIFGVRNESDGQVD